MKHLSIILFTIFFFTKASAQLPHYSISITSQQIVPYDALKEGKKVLELVNTLRKQGCTCGETVMPPTDTLVFSVNLSFAAYRHAEDMFQNSYFNHVGSDGSSIRERYKDAGYTALDEAENIGDGFRNARQAIKGWKNSPMHCLNIMNPVFKDLGLARKKYYWVLTLGAGN